MTKHARPSDREHLRRYPCLKGSQVSISCRPARAFSGPTRYFSEMK